MAVRPKSYERMPSSAGFHSLQEVTSSSSTFRPRSVYLGAVVSLLTLVTLFIQIVSPSQAQARRRDSLTGFSVLMMIARHLSPHISHSPTDALEQVLLKALVLPDLFTMAKGRIKNAAAAKSSRPCKREVTVGAIHAWNVQIH